MEKSNVYGRIAIAVIMFIIILLFIGAIIGGTLGVILIIPPIIMIFTMAITLLTAGIIYIIKGKQDTTDKICDLMDKLWP